MPGYSELPPLPRFQPGLYADLNPRWSHDGRRIAFLRATPDRKLQLYAADARLRRPLALLEAELVCPDRPYDASRLRYGSPDTLAWSPDDSEIAFARIEWFTFDDGERLPGTGLWALHTRTGRVTPLALHPPRYTSLFYYYRDPQWSPDGRYLAFAGGGVNGQSVIFARPLARMKAQAALPRYDTYESSDWPVWEPMASGPDAAFGLTFRQGVARGSGVPPTETLRRIRPGGAQGQDVGEIWRLSYEQFARLSGNSRVAPRLSQPVWSPDGLTLAFALNGDPLHPEKSEIWTLQRDGAEARRASPRDGQGYCAPVWIDNETLGALSPRGARFAVVTWRVKAKTVSAAGLIDSADCDWSPDRRQIVYAAPLPMGTSAGAKGMPPTTLRLFDTGLGKRLRSVSRNGQPTGDSFQGMPPNPPAPFPTGEGGD